MLAALLAASTMLAVAPEPVPQPQFKRADVQTAPKRQKGERIVGSRNGSFYVLRTAPGAGNWPVVYVDRHDETGRRLWSHLHPVPRNTAGVGFTSFGDASMDTNNNLHVVLNTKLYPYRLLAKITPDETLAWEVSLNHCDAGAKVVPVPGSHDVLVACERAGIMRISRHLGSDGSEVWRYDSGNRPKKDNRVVARFDNDKDLIVASDWSEGPAATAVHGIRVAKFKLDGSKVWERTSSLPSRYGNARANLVDMFVQPDGGFVAVFDESSRWAIEVQRYSATGRLQARHAIEPTLKQAGMRGIMAKHAHRNGKPMVTVAWSEYKKTNGPTLMMGITPIYFKSSTIPRYAANGAVTTTSSTASSGAKGGKGRMRARAVQRLRWEAVPYYEHRFAVSDHDILHGFALATGGRPYLVVTDTGSIDRVRLTAVPMLASGHRRSAAHAPPGRHARGIDIFLGKQRRAFVLATVGTQAGQYNGPNANVGVFEFSQITSKKPKATPSAAQNAGGAATPTARPATKPKARPAARPSKARPRMHAK
ncbi:MAG: hypothetical protein AAF721_02780 [Myxococcota bacterium]